MSSTQLAGADAPIFTLVAYIPEPLGGFLTALRAALPDQKGGVAHLTLLPPRPLQGDMNGASAELQQSLQAFQSYKVDLAGVERFETTGVVYLAVGEGDSESRRIHRTLNNGPFSFSEPFEYTPHITLACPPPGADPESVARAAKQLWADCPYPKHFELKAVDFLRQNPDGLWQRVWQSCLR